MVSYAISMSDFVVIPFQGSQLDAKQAARQMKLIKAQERIAGRAIPFAVLFTRTNPAIHAEDPTSHRRAFPRAKRAGIRDQAVRSRSVPRHIFLRRNGRRLKDKGVSNVPAALSNALEFTSEVIERLRNGNRSIEKEVA